MDYLVQQDVEEAHRSGSLMLCDYDLEVLPDMLLAQSFITDRTPLRSCVLARNRFREIPAELISAFPSLVILSFARNRLHTLPSELPRLRSLVELDLSYNELQSVPSSLGAMPALEKLFLDHNRIVVADAFGQIGFPKLMELHLSGNQIESLPSCFPQTLRVLCVASNFLKSLPSGLADLPVMDVFDASGNPFTSAELKRVINSGWHAVKGVLQQSQRIR
jgi:Leucine-rich repeat (LRR) protein